MVCTPTSIPVSINITAQNPRCPSHLFPLQPIWEITNPWRLATTNKITNPSPWIANGKAVRAIAGINRKGHKYINSFLKKFERSAIRGHSGILIIESRPGEGNETPKTSSPEVMCTRITEIPPITHPMARSVGADRPSKRSREQRHVDNNGDQGFITPHQGPMGHEPHKPSRPEPRETYCLHDP